MQTVLEHPINWDWNAKNSTYLKAVFLDEVMSLTQDTAFSALMKAKAMPKDIFMSTVANLVRAYGFVVSVNGEIFGVYKQDESSQIQDNEPVIQNNRWEHYIDDLHRDVDDYDG